MSVAGPFAEGPLAEAPAPEAATDPEKFQWTVGKIFLSLFLFVAAGAAEIGGGWLVWQTLRNNKAWFLAVIGSLVLVLYGVLPTFQPMDNFGRVRGGQGSRVCCTETLAHCLRRTAHFWALTPCRQVYAVYGGFFIILSYLWGWAVDKERPDVGDWVGSAIALAGVCVAFFWPRH